MKYLLILLLLTSCSTFPPHIDFDTSNLYNPKYYHEKYHSCRDIEKNPPVRGDNQIMCNCNEKGELNAK